MSDATTAIYLAVALGGAAGGALRHLVGAAVAARTGGRFPWGTWVVNVTGSALIGLLVPVLGHAGPDGSPLAHALVVGLCGSYTTVSAFALQSAELHRGGHHGTALLYAGGSVLACMVAVAAGYALGLLWATP